MHVVVSVDQTVVDDAYLVIDLSKNYPEELLLTVSP